MRKLVLTLMLVALGSLVLASPDDVRRDQFTSFGIYAQNAKEPCYSDSFIQLSHC